MLGQMGLLETFGMDWDVYVGLQFKPEYEKNYLLAPAGSLVSSVPGMKEVFGDKEAFTRLWRKCLDTARTLADTLEASARERLCAWTTPAFNAVHKKLDDGTAAFAVEGGADHFRGLLEHEGPSTWIVKPQRRYLTGWRTFGRVVLACLERLPGSLSSLQDGHPQNEVPLERSGTRELVARL